MPQFTEKLLRPLDGGLDAITQSGMVGWGSYRIVLNATVSEQRKRCRMGGWTKYLGAEGDAPYVTFKNQDLHDQLLGCQFYQDAYSYDEALGNEHIGYAYPYWWPEEEFPEQFADTGPFGPYCGYGPDYPQYPPSPAGEGWFRCGDTFTGYPYNIYPCGGEMEFADSSWATGDVGGVITWMRAHVLNGLAYLQALEDANGPSQAITDARHFLNAIYVPATNNTTDPQGFFSGTDGLCHYTYDLDFDPDIGDGVWTTDFHFWSEGLEFQCPCGVYVGDNYYSGSYFDLCYRDVQEGHTVPGYGYGDGFDIRTPPYEVTHEYCGQDYHYMPGCRQDISLLFELNASSGRRKLIAGTRSRIYAANERAGNWRIIADGLGGVYDAADCDCSSIRFKAAQLGDYVLFTNNFDPVLAWRCDDPPAGCDFWSAEYVPDLMALGISHAGVVASWQGFMFVADVTVEGRDYPGRTYWSDFNAPLEFIPTNESLAGYHEFSQGERILAIEPIGGQLRFYTDKAIYEVALVDDQDLVMHFREIYRGPDVPRYRNAIVNTGRTHYYLGESTIFSLSEYDRTPVQIDWVHKASGVIYNGLKAEWLDEFAYLLENTTLGTTRSAVGPINPNRCDQAVGGYDTERKLLWFSWPTLGAVDGEPDHECPDMTLVLSTRLNAATIVDHGFTAFLTHRADLTPALRDTLAELGICDPAQFLLPKEGAPIDEPVSIDPPSYLFNETEDPNLPTDPDSVCARFAPYDFADFCDPCDLGPRFLMASAEDKCIKQYEDAIYFREMFVDYGYDYECPETAPGVYLEAGYSTMLQSDPWDYGVRGEKMCRMINIESEAVEQTIPNDLYCQLAYGQQPGCMTWNDPVTVPLECLTEYSKAEHQAMGTRPAREADFPFYRAGVYFAWRFYVLGTGGGSCFNSVVQLVRPKQLRLE